MAGGQSALDQLIRKLARHQPESQRAASLISRLAVQLFAAGFEQVQDGFPAGHGRSLAQSPKSRGAALGTLDDKLQQPVDDIALLFQREPDARQFARQLSPAQRISAASPLVGSPQHKGKLKERVLPPVEVARFQAVKQRGEGVITMDLLHTPAPSLSGPAGK